MDKQKYSMIKIKNIHIKNNNKQIIQSVNKTKIIKHYKKHYINIRYKTATKSIKIIMI